MYRYIYIFFIFQLLFAFISIFQLLSVFTHFCSPFQIEEQVLDSLAWQDASPLWNILKEEAEGVPSCKDVNFSHLLDSSDGTNDELPPPMPSQSLSPNSVIMSPAFKNRAYHSESKTPSNQNIYVKPKYICKTEIYM